MQVDRAFSSRVSRGVLSFFGSFSLPVFHLLKDSARGSGVLEGFWGSEGFWRGSGGVLEF